VGQVLSPEVHLRILVLSWKDYDDAVALQNNLDTLQQWEKDWLMSFNPDNCEVIRIINKKQIIDARYYMKLTEQKWH
jgi:hypothetical protein